MSDRTQSSVRTEDSSAAADPETAAITPDEPARSSSAPAAGAKGAPATAPGWGGATPSKQNPAKGAGGQKPAQQAPPAGQAPAGPTQPAGKPAQQSGRPAGNGQPAGARPAGQRPAAAAGATVGAARQGAPQTGARPANRAAAGAPRPATDRPPSVVARAAEGRGPESAEGERPSGKVRGSGRGPRRARLQLRHIDTWSALKISLVLAIALFFVWMVAVGVLYGVLNGLGVFTTVNDLIGQLGSSSGDAGPTDVITPGIVFGGAAVIGAVNIVLFTALCTVGTFVYNLCADLVGGLEVTLSERD
ncbi:DUF3566 domain-containing protein [Klenkia terrae]|jgi:hypothetical protein|uniref:DUF3566 domain-containing protein n=1 Tax=Klenkia terrae TaxID=1052259 RepID=A0ABU8E8F6_9ACTN|nr:DUF3566 domain-containing protein [Klenkia terrae]SSC23653.1 Protein with domain of unknown function DUF3566 [Klenkia terrae]